MMKGSDIGIQEKKDKLFNEWEMFTSTNGESIESYYHCFSKLMNDFKRNKHFPEKIASNLKFLKNLQPEWSRHVTIVHQTKDLHTTDYTQLYDFLIYIQKEVDDLRAERLAKTHDPLALMANSNNPFNYLVFHQDQPSSNPTTAMNMALVLMANAFKLNYSTPTNNNQIISSNPCNRQIAQPGMNLGQDRHTQMVGGNGENQFSQYTGQNVGNQNGYNAVQNVKNQAVQNANPNGNGNVVVARAKGNANGNKGNQIRCYNCRGSGYLARNYIVRLRRRDTAYLQTQLLIAQKEEASIQIQDEEFDLMAAAADLDEIEEVNANCILMANLQQASTLGTQTDKAPVYDSDGSAEVHHYDNCYNNDIFNIFTQEEKYTELLEPILEPHQVQQNDSNVISKVSSVEQIITEYLVKLSKRRAFWSLNEDILKIMDSDYQYAVSIKKDTAYLCLHSPKTTKETRSIRRIQRRSICRIKDIVCKDSGRYQAWSLLQETPIRQAAKFVRDYKSLTKEADESLAQHKALELEIERLLRAVVSQDIMSIVQSNSVVDTSNL
ncbi:hypothetical protein Tco_0339531 [Tanacetum coccineum]